jgi:hypothetical protein
MARERMRLDPGSSAAPWLAYTDLEPVAAPAEEVAQLLGVTVEDVHRSGVEPYRAADGRQLVSIHLVGVALGLRRGRVERERQRNRQRSPEAMERRREQSRKRRRREREAS